MNDTRQNGGSPRTDTDAGLARRMAKLEKINAALMNRVERSMDQQANAFSLFQTAIGLENQVRLRTEELNNALRHLERTNEELISARDASERANRFKTRFFTAVGHDLLQPLHAARLSLSALQEGEKGSETKRLADRIEHALSTVEQLLKSILDISKLEAGVIQPSFQKVALGELFASLAVDIEPLARSKQLSLTFRPTGLAVASDPIMLRRILQNLLVNAVHYTQAGGIKLTARRRGDLVRTEIWDTGTGIPAAERDRIFEEFQRGVASERSQSSGFGLGLSIVKRMAETLGHSIDLVSRLGRGTRFSVTAPFAGLADRMSASPALASAGQTYGLARKKVIVIDNDTTVLEAMRVLLDRWGCEARYATDLESVDAISRDIEFRPEMVLADYHLDNGVCGLGAVERLRATSNPDLAGIIITADHSQWLADEARRSGCELLLKPVKPAELRALMLHLLS